MAVKLDKGTKLAYAARLARGFAANEHLTRYFQENAEDGTVAGHIAAMSLDCIHELIIKINDEPDN